MQCQRQCGHFLCRGDENYMGCKARVLLTQCQGWTMVCLLRGRGGLSSDSMNYAITEIVFWRSRNRAEMSAVSPFPPRRPNLLQQSICKHFGLKFSLLNGGLAQAKRAGTFSSFSFFLYTYTSKLFASNNAECQCKFTIFHIFIWSPLRIKFLRGQEKWSAFSAHLFLSGSTKFLSVSSRNRFGYFLLASLSLPQLCSEQQEHFFWWLPLDPGKMP